MANTAGVQLPMELLVGLAAPPVEMSVIRMSGKPQLRFQRPVSHHGLIVVNTTLPAMDISHLGSRNRRRAFKLSLPGGRG